MDVRRARVAPRARRARCSRARAAPRPGSSSTTTRPRCCSRSARWRADREVIVSRGELVEIGGGFRVPEIMAESRLPARRGRHHQPHAARRLRGAAAARDRARAEGARVELPDGRVHRGDERSPSSASLGPPVMVDAGSGLARRHDAVAAAAVRAWLHDEPGVRQAHRRRRGARDVLGRQAARRPAGRGRSSAAADLVAAVARHPLARAMRADKVTLAALQHVALAYLSGDATPISVVADGDACRSTSCAARAEAIADAVAERARSSTPRRSPAAGRCPG